MESITPCDILTQIADGIRDSLQAPNEPRIIGVLAVQCCPDGRAGRLVLELHTLRTEDADSPASISQISTEEGSSKE